MFRLDEVVPWRRSFEEYRRMFALAELDRDLRNLGCGDGPAAFNAEATCRERRVVSCDPIYRFDADGLRVRIDATRAEVLRQTRDDAGRLVWHTIRSIEELARLSQAAMDVFLADHRDGRAALREPCGVAGKLRIIPLRDPGGRPSPWLQPPPDSLASDGFAVSIEAVPHEFQLGADRMMRILPGPAAGRRRDARPRGGRASSL